jgi:hypothetical protein
MRTLLVLLKEMVLGIVLTALVFIFIGLMTPFVGLFMVALFIWAIIELLIFCYKLIRDLIFKKHDGNN